MSHLSNRVVGTGGAQRAVPEMVLVDADGNIIGSLGGPGGGPGADRELVVSTYTCKTAFTGASVGDTITATQIIDVSATPTHVSTIWRNQTTAANLASAPSAANLELLGSQALTAAQLTAAGLASEATQAAISNKLPNLENGRLPVRSVDRDDPFSVAGRTVDASKNVVFNYDDGTSETFEYTTAGLLAGKSARA